MIAFSKDNDPVPLDGALQARIFSRLLDHVDRTAQNSSQFSLDLSQLPDVCDPVPSRGWIEADSGVHVGTGLGLAAGDRTEDGEARHTERAKVIGMPQKRLDRIRAIGVVGGCTAGRTGWRGIRHWITCYRSVA